MSPEPAYYADVWPIEWPILSPIVAVIGMSASGQKRTSRPMSRCPLGAKNGHQPSNPVNEIDLIFSLGDRVLPLIFIPIGNLHGAKIEGQLVDLAVEGERHLVILVVNPCAGVDANVESLVRHL